MSETASPVCVAALYRFAAIEDREIVRVRLLDLCGDEVRGTLLVPYQSRLSADDYAEFERRYDAELALVIGGEHGERTPYFYGFERILRWGRRGR